MGGISPSLFKGDKMSLNLMTINEFIDEMEQADLSLSTIRNLSALYNVRSHILGSNKVDNAVKELNDILPSYLNYIKTKRQYQLKEITETNVLLQLGNVCKEIREFIQTLYNGTDTPEERKLITNLIDQLKEAF